MKFLFSYFTAQNLAISLGLQIAQHKSPGVNAARDDSTIGINKKIIITHKKASPFYNHRIFSGTRSYRSRQVVPLPEVWRPAQWCQRLDPQALAFLGFANVARTKNHMGRIPISEFFCFNQKFNEFAVFSRGPQSFILFLCAIAVTAYGKQIYNACFEYLGEHGKIMMLGVRGDLNSSHGRA
jgi:hypothetical protein